MPSTIKEAKYSWGDVLRIIEEMLNTLKLAIYGCSRYNIIQWMIYASIFRPFSSNFLPAYHYVYALDYHAVFPQFCVSLPHYSHYGVTLRMDMRRFHSAQPGQVEVLFVYILGRCPTLLQRSRSRSFCDVIADRTLLLARGQCHE